MPRLAWKTVESEASEIFSIWMDQPELAWAKRAWKILADAGLTFYSGEVEVWTVRARLYALGVFYHSFCERAWQEGAADQVLAFGVFVDEVGTAFRLGQAVGKEFFSDAEMDDSELTELTISILVHEQYDVVVACLLAALGESGLFASLWTSPDRKLSGKYPLPDDVEWDVLSTDIWEKGAAFEWLRDGAELSFSAGDLKPTPLPTAEVGT